MYFTASRLQRDLERLALDCFSRTGLAPNQAFLLMTLQDSQGMTAGELALSLHLAPSTLTRFLDKLEARGLVRRRREGRMARVELSAKGARLRPALDAGWAELSSRYSALLGQEDARELTVSMLEAGRTLEGSGIPQG